MRFSNDNSNFIKQDIMMDDGGYSSNCASSRYVKAELDRKKLQKEVNDLKIEVEKLKREKSKEVQF